MNDDNENNKEKAVAVRPEPEPQPQPLVTGRADPKQLRTEHVGKLLEVAYQGASTLKLSRDEQKKLLADFPDEAIQIRPHDGIIYINHMALRERLWDVFGPGHVAEICRERTIRNDSNEIAVDLVLMIRGVFVGEGIGTAKYYPNNPKGSFGDTVESAWSEALRRCCKKFGVGVQVWRPQFIQDWLEKYAVQYQGRWHRKDNRAGEKTPTKGVGGTGKAKKTYGLRPDNDREQAREATPDPDWPDVEREERGNHND
jgi:hypothetical protein